MKTRAIIYSLIALAAGVVAYMRLTRTPQEQIINLEDYVPKSDPGKPQMAQMMDPVGGGGGGGNTSVKSPTVVDIYNKDKGPNPPKSPQNSKPK